MNSQKHASVGDMFDILSQAMKPVNDLFKLSAIHIQGVGRCAKGDEIYVDSSGNITKDSYAKTHSIEEVYGTLNNSRLEMDIKDLSDGELSHIEIN